MFNHMAFTSTAIPTSDSSRSGWLLCLSSSQSPLCSWKSHLYLLPIGCSALY